jgi:hypothetical protein
MTIRRDTARPLGLAAAALLALAARPRPGLAATGDAPDDSSPTFVAATDFTFEVFYVPPIGDEVLLTDDALGTAFGRARCSCPSDMAARLALTKTGMDKLRSGTLDVELLAGSACDATPKDCITLGQAFALKADSAENAESTQSFKSSALYEAASGSTTQTCSALKGASRRLWTIVRRHADAVVVPSPVRTYSIVSGGGPSAPTGVTAVTAENGLLVSWKPPASATGIAAYQVLCTPGKTAPDPPLYESCTDAPGGADSGPFTTLDNRFVCSGRAEANTTSIRVSGLENGRSYTLAVIAISADGTPSKPSDVATGVPGPTVGFFDRYQADGGTAAPGCSFAPRPRAPGAGLAAAAFLLFLAVRRRRRARGLALAALAIGVTLGQTAPAQAREIDGFTDAAQEGYDSPHHWNFELRLGPYRPDIDAELASRGVDAHPFRDTFGNGRRLMTQLEIDRQVLDRGGTLAIGLSAGQFRATGTALAADGTSKSGDETSLLLVPLSASLVYRASFLERRWGIPFVPFAKAGLDYTYWSVGHSGRSETPDGGTWGWHGAAGLAMYLDFLDPEAARTLDNDAGVNHTAIFFEVTRYRIDGLGAANKLRLGDTTWFAGLMLEL